MEDDLIMEFEHLKISIINKLQKINLQTNETNLNEFISTEDTEVKFTDFQEEEYVEPVSVSSSPIQGYIKTLENQRRKEVVNNVQERLKKIEDFAKQQEINKKKQWLKKQQEFVNDIQQKEDHIFQVLKEYDKNSSNNHAQLALYYKNLEIRRQQQENEIKKREKERQILYDCVDKIKKLQFSFRSVYEQFLTSVKRCTNLSELKTSLTEELQLPNILRSNFETIVSRLKTGKIAKDEVEKASYLFVQLQKVEKKISERVDEINAKEKEENIPKPVQPVHVEVEDKPAVTVRNTAPTESINLNKYVSTVNLQLYLNLLEFLEKYIESFKDLENDPSKKPFILDCKKSINIPVNSLSGLNSDHILDKYNKLYGLLKGQDVFLTNKRVNAAAFPEGIAFCTNLLAKKFVLQSDLIISSNPESAFCYATVIMSLWNEFPQFGQLILAYFFKTCPYLVPYHIPRLVGESDEEYYKRQGYQYNDGQIEKQDKFLKRMTGLMRLYAAIMVVKPKRGHNNIYNISNGWKWLTSTLKLEPQLDITATLVHTFLETAGFELEARYAKFFQKIIRIISEKFIPNCREKCTGGAVTRLELLIVEYYKKRKFEIPDGYMGYNYW